MEGNPDTGVATALAGSPHAKPTQPLGATVAFAAAVGFGALPFVPRLVTLAGVAVLAALAVAASRASLRAAFTTALLAAVAVAAWTARALRGCGPRRSSWAWQSLASWRARGATPTRSAG
ncbi:MAG: hypothetical protein NVSMB23_23090 [Myxococcales bacterium]